MLQIYNILLLYRIMLYITNIYHVHHYNSFIFNISFFRDRIALYYILQI